MVLARFQAAGRSRQRGVTLFGLMFWAVVVGSVAILIAKVAPVLNEYRTLQGMVNKIAHGGGTSVPEIRAAFDKLRVVEYGIESISSRDLVITKDDDKVVVSFAYDKEIELVSPVYLLIKFQGQSK